MGGEAKVGRMGALLFGVGLVAVLGAGAYVMRGAASLPAWLANVMPGSQSEADAVLPTPPVAQAPTPAAAPAPDTAPRPEVPAAPTPAAEVVPSEMPVLMPVEEDEPAELPEDVLLDAVDRGDLGLGTYGDVTRWHARHRARVPGAAATLPDHFEHLDVYIVKRAFRIPPGLAGANAVVFIVPEGAPMPKGDPGHSPILDMDSGACRGSICMLLRQD